MAADGHLSAKVESTVLFVSDSLSVNDEIVVHEVGENELGSDGAHSTKDLLLDVDADC